MFALAGLSAPRARRPAGTTVEISRCALKLIGSLPNAVCFFDSTSPSASFGGVS
jgi:hypothetical protein